MKFNFYIEELSLLTNTFFLHYFHDIYCFQICNKNMLITSKLVALQKNC